MKIGEDYGPLTRQFFQKYFNVKSKVDMIFGIRFENGKSKMGYEAVNINGDNSR